VQARSSAPSVLPTREAGAAVGVGAGFSGEGRNGSDAAGHVDDMGVVLVSQRLHRELARRGWNSSILAREAGVSPPTVSAALAGRPIAPKSVRMMAAALARVPPVPAIDALIRGGKARDGLG